MEVGTDKQSFWDHLDMLRVAIVKSLLVAIVGILVVAAIITPTSDVFTLSLVALPMWILYEISILIVNRTNTRRNMQSDTLSHLS